MWHDFFKEKPEGNKEVLWYIYGACYDVGAYKKGEEYELINFNYERMIWDEEFYKYEFTGIYWHELPEPPEKPKEAIV